MKADRVRAHLAKAEWIDPAALARSAAHLAEAEATLQAIADDIWQAEAVVAMSGHSRNPACRNHCASGRTSHGHAGQRQRAGRNRRFPEKARPARQFRGHTDRTGGRVLSL